MMGQTSVKLTWPVRTHAGAWDDSYDEPCKHKECDRHLWTRLYGLHTSKCDVDHGHRESVAILDSAYRGGHYSKITFIVGPLHITLHFCIFIPLK